MLHCLLLGAFVLVILLPVVVTLSEEAIIQWRYRHIPGPPQRWLLGNLLEVMEGGLLPTVDRWVAKYGKVFKIRLMCHTLVVVADPDAARMVMTKVTNHVPIQDGNSSMVAGELRAMDMYGLATATGDYWRMLRTAWQPAFSPASLRGYQALMDREALALVARLEGRLRGEWEQEQEEEGSKEAAKKALLTANGGKTDSAIVEMHTELSRATLSVVGTVAYGVDFNAPEYVAAPAAGTRRGQQLSLVEGCMAWFRTMAPAHTSKWTFAGAFPRFLPLLRHLANAFPDAALAHHIQARRVVAGTALRLIQGWRQAEEGAAAPAAAERGSPIGQEAAGASADGNRGATIAGPQKGGDHTKPVAAAVAPSKPPGIAPGSFLGLMLATRNKSCGRGLSDIELAAQVEMFLLAAFETTANALTFALYHLALNPGAAKNLREEVDHYVPPLGHHVTGEAEPLTAEVLDKLVYAEAVLQEALRLHPPVPNNSRYTDIPMKVLGHDVPGGTGFFIPVHHMHHTAEVWADSQAFRPERFLTATGSVKPLGAADMENGGDGGGDRSAHDHTAAAVVGTCGGGGDKTCAAARHPHAYLPFGAGPRMCIGWRFAIQEAKTVLARLFQRFHFELVPGQVPLELAVGITLAPQDGVIMRLRRRMVDDGATRGQCRSAASLPGGKEAVDGRARLEALDTALIDLT